MASNTLTIGNVTVISLSDGYLRGTAKETFPDVPETVWACGCSIPESAAVMDMNMGSFLVMSGGRNIFVDTGMGPAPMPEDQGKCGLLMDNFQKEGLDVNEVDTVFMTHLHFDHVGWNLSNGSGLARPTFPRARYVCSTIDWNFFNQVSNPEGVYYDPRPVEPLEGLGVLDLIDGEHNLTDELTAIPTPGHTPGHMSIIVSSAGEKGLILGDVAHHPLQVHETGWDNSADIDHQVAHETRESMMKRVEEEGLTMAAGHFPDPGFGKIVRLEGKRFWQVL